ncbi:hypothetical protein ACE38W_02895 [Chitinophaga sp. Hz27]|uniref:hypothetical protein n=1 Tax=Chitinophaga sp. Hz27 TaxID=3347169 RepID=UPI0035E33594
MAIIIKLSYENQQEYGIAYAYAVFLLSYDLTPPSEHFFILAVNSFTEGTYDWLLPSP